MRAVVALPRVHGPGLAWLPAPLRQRRYWAVVGRFALFGPLLGGAPYVWMVFTIPFAYAFGLVPATVAGALYAGWLLSSGRPPTAAWRAMVGAICGAAACAVCALAVSPRSPAGAWFVLAAHGVPAAALLALVTRTVGRAGKRGIAEHRLRTSN